MSQAVDLRVLELLAARLCHDLIGPVAAIGNGAELLADEEPDFVKDAIALVGESARKANRQLQFYRFAYGFSGGELAGLPPYRLASAFLEENSIACDYREAARRLSLEGQKLACNMLAIAGDALPRGGQLVLDVGAGRPQLEATGEGAGPSAETAREVRAVEALEAIGTPQARRVLDKFAAGPSGMRLTEEAKASADRLPKRSSIRP